MRVLALVFLVLSAVACAPSAEAQESGKTAAQLQREADGEPLTPGGVLTEILEGRLVYEDDKAIVIFTGLRPSEVQGRLGTRQEMFPAPVNLGVTIDTGGRRVLYSVRDGVLSYTANIGRIGGLSSSTSTSTTCTSRTTADGSRFQCTRGGQLIYQSTCTVQADNSITCRSTSY